MNLESMSFKAKDLVQLGLYVISLSVFFVSMSNSVDKLTVAVAELKSEKKEDIGENKASNFITQNDIKALSIRAELNRQNIEIIQKDVEMLKIQYESIKK